MRPAGAGYQADGWSVDQSFAEVAGDAMRVTGARDELWHHLAHDGRQERVPVTSSAPPSHRPSQHGAGARGQGVAEVEAKTNAVYPASPSAFLMTTRRSCSWAGAGGELGLGGGILRVDDFRLVCQPYASLLRSRLSFTSYYIILHHTTLQHRNIVSVTSISSVLTV